MHDPVDRKDGTPTWVDISSQKTGEYQGYGVFFNFVSDVNKRIENEQIVQKAYETMQYRASHDSLTGICFNRDNFICESKNYLRSESRRKLCDSALEYREI